MSSGLYDRSLYSKSSLLIPEKGEFIQCQTRSESKVFLFWEFCSVCENSRSSELWSGPFREYSTQPSEQLQQFIQLDILTNRWKVS